MLPGPRSEIDLDLEDPASVLEAERVARPIAGLAQSPVGRYMEAGGAAWHTCETPTWVVQVLPDEDECAVAGEVDDVWKPALAGVAGERGRE